MYWVSERKFFCGKQSPELYHLEHDSVDPSFIATSVTKPSLKNFNKQQRIGYNTPPPPAPTACFSEKSHLCNFQNCGTFVTDVVEACNNSLR